MAGGARIKIKGGIASKNEALVTDGAIHVTGAGPDGTTGFGYYENHLYGEDSGTGVTNINLFGDNDEGVGIVVANNIIANRVACTFRHTTVPPGPGVWTARLLVLNTTTNLFETVATFTVNTI